MNLLLLLVFHYLLAPLPWGTLQLCLCKNLGRVKQFIWGVSLEKSVCVFSVNPVSAQNILLTGN